MAKMSITLEDVSGQPGTFNVTVEYGESGFLADSVAHGHGALLADLLDKAIEGPSGLIEPADDEAAAMLAAMHPPCPECGASLSRAKGPGNPIGRLHCANASCGRIGILLNHQTLAPMQDGKRLALVMPH